METGALACLRLSAIDSSLTFMSCAITSWTVNRQRNSCKQSRMVDSLERTSRQASASVVAQTQCSSYRSDDGMALHWLRCSHFLPCVQGTPLRHFRLAPTVHVSSPLAVAQPSCRMVSRLTFGGFPHNRKKSLGKKSSKKLDWQKSRWKGTTKRSVRARPAVSCVI
eukprot:COSAG02_NODE_302_length_25234_cov_43.365307_16_plen_166_part_00